MVQEAFFLDLGTSFLLEFLKGLSSRQIIAQLVLHPFIYIFSIITVAWSVNVAKKRKIIYNKVALSRKKQDDFNFTLELKMGNFSQYSTTISTTLPGLVSMSQLYHL